jgi:pimeloyl-ACP methyl ester carboxylesterase
MDGRRIAEGTATLGARTRLHWDSAGEGAPVLLITGIGLSGGSWWRTVPVLAERFRVLTYDNRGIGRSTTLNYNYTTEAMADDAVAVLDSAGVARAHVYGMSLGGMVAQQLALRHPDRVAALVLGCTQPGGRRAVRADEAALAFFRRRARLPAEESAWASVPYNYGRRCRYEHTQRIAEDIARRLANPFNERAYRAQLCAGMLHNCLGRLEQIAAPTLIVHGRDDRVIPAANAELMAERIPNVQVRLLEECGHMFPTEDPDVDREIGDFLAEAPA